MPTVSCITKAGTVLNFSNSIDFTDYDSATQTDADCDLLQQAIAASPDCEEFLTACREKLKLLNHKAYEYHDIYTEKQLVLSEAGAMWGGTFGGHANPENFESYEALEQAFFRQLEYITVNACGMANSAQLYRAKYKPNPLRSCLVEGCLEKGIDFRNGGPRYNHGQILAEGIADTGDSLYAVKKLVYDQKKYTMKQLITALKADFVGYENLRIDFARCEKFGNDHTEVDQITTRIVNRFLTVLKRINTYRGGRYSGGCSPFYRTASYGRRLAALPNGRRNGDELIADCIGAVPGENSNGPTALLNSVLGYDHKNAGSGFIMQIKFDKKLFDTEHGKKVFIALAKTYFKEGGQQLTTTVVNPHDLIDALENPQKHKDLIVRVGGYSAKFIDLERGVQDNIIKRTYIT